MPELQSSVYDRAGGFRILREDKSLAAAVVFGMPTATENGVVQGDLY
jgi:hypothetical protein